MRRLGDLLIPLTALIFLVALVVPPAAAQIQDLVVAEASSDGRNITLTVVAPAGMRDAEVGPGSFTVDIDGERIEPAVTRVPGDDLDVVLLIDVSGSMTPEALAAAKASASSFVRQLPVDARVSVVSFGDEATVVEPFTTDQEAVIAQINGLEAFGETALYAGVIAAAQQFDPSVDAIRTVVLLSDGGNTVEESSLGGAQAALINSDATLHAISIETVESNPAELDELARATGGTVARAEQVEALEALYRTIALDLGNQYRLSFIATGNGETEAEITAYSGDVAIAQTSLSLRLPAAAAPPAVGPTPLPLPTTVPLALNATPPAATVTDVSDPVWIKWGAIGSLSMAIAVASALVLTPGRKTLRRKPRQWFAETPVRDGGGVVRRVSDALTGAAERLLRRGRIGEWLSVLLDTAGWKLRNSEFVVLVGLLTITAFFAGALASPALGVTLAVLVLLTVTGLLLLLVNRRRDAFAEQLNGTFQMMAGGLRTGYSLPQVMVLLSNEQAPPTSEEFSRVVTETRLGRDLIDSIRDVARRMKSADFEWAAGAIDISRDVGGDLAEVLDNVAETIRTRERVRRQVSALSAEGRVSAWILLVLPFPLFFWQLLVNRDYTLLLFTTTLGRMIFASAIVLLVLGAIWMRKIVRVSY